MIDRRVVWTLPAILLLAGCAGNGDGMSSTPIPAPTATATPDPQLAAAQPLAVSPEVAAFGRDVFEHETFGNEAFWTGIVGLLNGSATVGDAPVSLLADVILPSIDALDGTSGNLFECPGGVCNGGAFTANLTVTIPPDTSIDGGRIPLPAGSFATGLAVAPGSPVPVGVIPVDVGAGTPGSVVTPLNAAGRAFSFGVACAVCHVPLAADGTKRDGLPNTQLQVGAIFALAANSAALYPLSGVKPSDRDPFAADGTFDADGDGVVDADRSEDFETAVDLSFLGMPKGYFDATPDARLDPSQIPHTIAEGNGPFLWDGLFPKLTNLDGFVHGVDLDLSALAPLASTLALAPSDEAYLASIFQASPAAAEFADFAAYDTARGNGTDVPGVLRLASATQSGLALLPAGALLADGVTGFRPVRPDPGIAGLPADNAALEAEERFQRSLRGPANASAENAAALASGSVARGARVSVAARCTDCHTAPFFNVNRDGSAITALAAIATEPSRAQFGAGLLKAAGTGFQTAVGYKNQSHRFLFATPPYLHDGGIAAADTNGDGEADLFGVVDTLFAGTDPQARASLQALLDPVLQQRCIDANTKPNPLTGVAPADLHITGEGHPFYVADGIAKPGGGTFTRQDREDLISFLLALDDRPAE